MRLDSASYPYSEWSEVAILVHRRADHTPLCVTKLQRLPNHRKQIAQFVTSVPNEQSSKDCRPFRTFAVSHELSKSRDSAGVKADFLALDYAYNELGALEFRSYAVKS